MEYHGEIQALFKEVRICDTNLFPKIQKMPEYSRIPKLCALNEDYKIMDYAKFRPKSYYRKDPEHLQSLPCWHRVYMDRYGGGRKSRRKIL